MLKTGKSTWSTVLPTWTILLLTFLILVMSAHILLDDLSFSLVKHLNPTQSEITHQDDLVYLSELDPQLSAKAIIQIAPVLMTIQAMRLFFNFNPPKNNNSSKRLALQWNLEAGFRSVTTRNIQFWNFIRNGIT